MAGNCIECYCWFVLNRQTRFSRHITPMCSIDRLLFAEFSVLANQQRQLRVCGCKFIQSRNVHCSFAFPIKSHISEIFKQVYVIPVNTSPSAPHRAASQMYVHSICTIRFQLVALSLIALLTTCHSIEILTILIRLTSALECEPKWKPFMLLYPFDWLTDAPIIILHFFVLPVRSFCHRCRRCSIPTDLPFLSTNSVVLLRMRQKF